MSTTKTKESILAALEAGYVGAAMVEKLRTGYLTKGDDYAIADLGLDSLGLMEFCISLEVNDVISMSPEDVLRLNSLNAIARFIEGESVD